MPSGRLYSGDAGLSFNGRSVFSVWRMTARLDESFIKTQLALRSMEWQLSVFVEVEENLSPGPQPQHRTFNAEISKLKCDLLVIRDNG